MERSLSLEEISDGKLYGSNDMVKADCGDCKGCSACCRGMGKSVTLDPLDVYRITGKFETPFEAFLKDRAELGVVDGIILPNLRMTGKNQQCVYLNEEGRCSIHSVRPGFCRIFPLGRIYENRSFRYFLQIHECPKENRTKVKVRKWIDTPDVKRYEEFVGRWHYFLRDVGQALSKAAGEEREKLKKTVNIYILEQFFLRSYDWKDEFYSQFDSRFQEAGDFMGRLGITLDGGGSV